MQGCIRTRHLLLNAHTIIREFGVSAYLRCIRGALFSRRKVTFLECVFNSHTDSNISLYS